MSDELVLAKRENAVLTLILNRPERLNAWTDAMEEHYFDLLAEADSDPDVKAIVVTGAGRGFCAGADMDVLENLSEDDSRYRQMARPKTFPFGIRKPLIAAINGACAGIGLIQALYCDVRFVSSEAKITTAFARRGLVAEHGISWVLPRLVGPSRALDLLMSARVVRGDEAAALGLANWAVEPADVLPRAQEYARDLATNCSPRAVATIKRQLHAHLSTGLDAALAEANEDLLESFTWPDMAEGVASFLERREPQFPPLA